jgi:hypothetical protein
VQPAAAYLDSLNPEQRRAVEHGAAGQGPCAPLLVIAGAGSGKTNTLAHRVTHLIVNGASSPHPADDVLAPGRFRDDEACRADCSQDHG